MEKQNLVQLDFGFELEPAKTSTQNQKSKSFKKTQFDFVLDVMDLLKSPIIVSLAMTRCGSRTSFGAYSHSPYVDQNVGDTWPH